MIEGKIRGKELQGLPENTRNQKRQEGSSPEPSERQHGPANTLILDFKPPELRDNKLFFLSHQVCGALLQQPQETNTKSNLSSAKKRNLAFVYATVLQMKAKLHVKAQGIHISPSCGTVAARWPKVQFYTKLHVWLRLSEHSASGNVWLYTFQVVSMAHPPQPCLQATYTSAHQSPASCSGDSVATSPPWSSEDSGPADLVAAKRPATQAALGPT